MSPSAVPPINMASGDEIPEQYEGDSAPQDNAGNGNPAKKTKNKKNRNRGGKKFKTARAAGLEEEIALTNVSVDKEDVEDAHHLNPTIAASKPLAVQTLASSDVHDSGTEHTDAVDSLCTNSEGNVTDQEGNGHPTSKTYTGAKFDQTAATWSEDTAEGDLWQRDPADNDSQDTPPPDTPKQRISNWFRAQARHPYSNLGRLLRDRSIEHVHAFKYPALAPADWPRTLRLMIWRAVVRANFFWKNPYTGEEISKPEPVVRPTGIYENSFEAFVECAAARLDRVGRDLPDPEYVKRVEHDVREFLDRVEKAGVQRQLEHLAFLLLFDEEQRKNALTLGELQERVRRTIAGNAIEWKGLEFVKRGKPPTKVLRLTTSVAMAEAVWGDIGKMV